MMRNAPVLNAPNPGYKKHPLRRELSAALNAQMAESVAAPAADPNYRRRNRRLPANQRFRLLVHKASCVAVYTVICIEDPCLPILFASPSASVLGPCRISHLACAQQPRNLPASQARPLMRRRLFVYRRGRRPPLCCRAQGFRGYVDGCSVFSGYLFGPLRSMSADL